VSNAHEPGEHYVWLAVDDSGLHGKVEISVDDLVQLDGIDLDPSVTLTTESLMPFEARIRAYVGERFGITTGDTPLTVDLISVEARSFDEGNYAEVNFRAATDRSAATDLQIRDEMLYETGRTHRGILLTTSDTKGNKNPEGNFALVFNANNTSQALNIDEPGGLLTNVQLIWQGVLHIWFGFDHVLFLLCLLLTAVLVREQGKWQAASDLKTVFWNVLKIVTMFTLAHSITLFLAGLDYARLPARPVESIIALSIIVVALSNIIGKFDSKKLVLVVAFGLFHGLGFASVMSVLPFRMENILAVVLSFNLGVELGQIAIVLAVLPLLFLIRKQSWYVPVVVKGASAVLIVIASVWLYERVSGTG